MENEHSLPCWNTRHQCWYAWWPTHAAIPSFFFLCLVLIFVLIVMHFVIWFMFLIGIEIVCFGFSFDRKEERKREVKNKLWISFFLRLSIENNKKIVFWSKRVFMLTANIQIVSFFPCFISITNLLCWICTRE